MFAMINNDDPDPDPGASPQWMMMEDPKPP
jgi:hypothetical protein